MVKVQQRFLICVVLASFAIEQPASARKFYPDDPLQELPKPRVVKNPYKRKFNEYYDFFLNTFFQPWEKHTPGNIIAAGAVNTLDEVPDSAWYTNRHGKKRMSLEELRRGPGVGHAPSQGKPWTVVAAKTEGITPGFTIQDAEGRRYLVKIDPLDYPEIATAADVIGSKFFYALGYYVPENYIVHFRRNELVVGGGAKFVDAYGKERMMKSRDLDEILIDVPRDREGIYRGVASYFIEGELLGPYRFHGLRRDDPNDIVRHEHRRDLRGLSVFAAWLGHNDIKSLNTLDSLIKDGPLQYIRHYLIDFGAAFGSDSFTIKSPRAGNEYLFAWKPSAVEFFTLGLHVPKWARADYPKIRGVGRFESKMFDPEEWLPNYPHPAFMNCLPEDAYWAAKQVARFTDEEIRVLVETGEFEDSRAVEWLTGALIERRDKIARAYLGKVLPLESFQVVEKPRIGVVLDFEDLEVKYGIRPRREYSFNWSRFDNEAEQKSPLPGETSNKAPEELLRAAPGSYYAVDIDSGEAGKLVIVYLRKPVGERIQVVGIERKWPPASGGERLSYIFGRTPQNETDFSPRAARDRRP